MRRLVLIAVLAAVVLAVTASAAMASRFDGYVGGAASGKGHNFVVGDGINLVFVDHRESYTPYRVCWHRVGHGHHRCWLGETGPAGRKNRIFTTAPSFVGTYVVEWAVRHHRKAVWQFENGVGD